MADGETPDGMAASSTVDENVEGALLGAITLSDQDAGNTHTLSTSDDRFVTKQDAEGGWWLALAEGVSLDHEAGDMVMVTVTVTDDGDPAMSASTNVTITVNDVNEAPIAVGMIDNVTGLTGDAIKADPLNLLMLFNDPDEGDSTVRYEMSGGPDWLSFSVQFGEDDDGNDTAHGVLAGTPDANDDGAHMVSIVAIDAEGEQSDPISFYVIIDDGNDDVTDVDFLIDGVVAVEAEVDENDASGVVFGEIRVNDQDHDMHPNGMHLIQILRGEVTDSATLNNPNAPVDSRFEVKYDDAGIPWLALKEGVSLDQEMGDGFVEVTIRAVDMNGATNSRGTAFATGANVAYQTVSIFINDQNDAPKANTIGNWWVTAESGQTSASIEKGDWLRFSLDTRPTTTDPATTGKPAFTDPDGDKLTYSLSGPNWVEINESNGEITNTKGGVPVRGVHTLTVTATDSDGASATKSFSLAVALSGDGTDATANDDNDEPELSVTSPQPINYEENSGERRVATFQITDADNDLGHHPFALDLTSVSISAVVNADDPTDINNQSGATFDENAGYAAAFRLSDPVKSGNSWVYHVYVRDTNSSATVDTTEVLDYESVDDIDITITFADRNVDNTLRVSTDNDNTFRINISPANDTPEAEAINAAGPGGTPAASNIAAGAYGVEQSESLKEVVYIKLEDIWDDEETDTDDLIFGLTVSGSWITILRQPTEWGDIEGIDWNDNTFGDATEANRTVVIVGDDDATPGANEWVAIIEIDRTGPNNGQGDRGSFTLTARDEHGATGSREYMIIPADENESVAPGAVSLSGSPREDATLRATFNDDRDPDLAGSAMPAQVLYQWYRVAPDTDGTPGTTETFVRQGTGNTYTLTQADAGSFIRVKVKYYEVGAEANAGQLVGNDVAADLSTTLEGTQINGDTTSRPVSNTPDKGAGSITVLAATNALSVVDAGVRVTDGDYPGQGAVADSALSYSWEMSDNGRGGWEAVTGANTATLSLDGNNDGTADGNGMSKYYRAVVTYDADGLNVDAADQEMESVYSDPIQVANIRDDAGTPPAIVGAPDPGGTLSINAPNTSVQWQILRGTDWVDIPGATGSLSLTSAHAGQSVRAVVSYHSADDDNPGVTAIIPTAAQPIGGAGAATAPPVQVGNHEIEASVMGTGHAPRDSDGSVDNAGHNLSVRETVDLRSLFQDPDTANLTYTVTADADSGLGTRNTTEGAGNTYLYDASAGGVLVFEVRGGMAHLSFDSDVYRTHDGSGADANDGAGNVITLNITANDSEDSSRETSAAAVSLRINVAPTDIVFTDIAGDSGSTPDGTGDNVAVNEHVGADAAGALGQLIATLNVQDQNQSGSSTATPPVRGHKFGTHDVEISGDDRFMITKSGNGRTDSDGDGSTWDVRLKPGAKLDFETDGMDFDPTTDADGDGNAANDKQIRLTVTATDGGGLSTPSGPGVTPIRLTITIVDVTAGDLNEPGTPAPNDVPGLVDNDTTPADNDDTTDGTDDDTDGGSQPPPPGMSLGGIIEDFVDNMDGFEQDLLEDFLLKIDDGLDMV